jgi:xylose isomerase
MALVDLRGQAKRRGAAALVKHLNSFSLDLRFSAGVWFFAPGGGRFHDRYVPPMSMEQILEVASGLAKYGLRGLEAHYPNEVNEDNLQMFLDFEKATGIRLITIVPNLFFGSQFEWGALSSPVRKARRAAIDRTITALKLNRKLNTDFSIVWPGIDGFENPFGMNMMAYRDRFCEGLAEAMDAVPGVRVAEEPKPYEPRGRIIYGTTPEGILMAQKVEGLLKHPKNKAILARGHAMVGMNPEVGHVLMGFEDLAYSLSLICEYGKLMHTHWNAQPLGNYDQDLNVGVISPEQTEAGLYVLKLHGYAGYFGIDINPERMPVERALINCMDALKAANDRIDRLDHAKVLYCTENPQKARGYLEAMLIRARAASTKSLSPMPRLRA